jgi:hypothetical protein
VVSDLSAARHAVPAIVAHMGLALIRMNDEEPTLEDVFVKMVGER